METEIIKNIHRIKQDNLSLLRKALERKDSYIEAMPVDMNIESTLKCNFRCRMCHLRLVPDKYLQISMGLELFKKIAEGCFSYLHNISLSVIGEPLLTDNLYEMLDIIDEHSVGLEVITNGSLLREDTLILRLLDVLSHIRVSLDATTSETYEKVRIGDMFEKVIENIKRFNTFRERMDNGPLLSFSFVAMRSNIEELPSFISLAKSLGAKAVYVAHLIVFKDEMQEESLIHHKDIANHNFLLAIKEAKRLDITLALPKLYETKSNNLWTKTSPLINPETGDALLREKVVINGMDAPWPVCKFLWAKPFIHNNGDVSACCGNVNRPVMGNILKQPFREIWNNDIYRRMRESFSTGELFDCCKNCTIFEW